MKHFIASLLLLSAVVVGCSSNDQPEPPKVQWSKGLYVLNEGLFNMNNSSLTRYDFETAASFTDFFELVNGRRLGDTGNDMGLYGSKLYVVTTGSSQLEVLDAATGNSIAQLPLFDGNRARQPRAITFGFGQVFVACFDGSVLAFDTTRLQLQAIGRAGQNPDGIVWANDKLYISNSGGLNYPNYDSTVSVFDPLSLTEISRIVVGLNPGAICADKRGNVYVVSRGNYADIPSRIQVIDSQIDQVVHTLQIPVQHLFVYGDTAWLIHIDYSGSMSSTLALLNLQNLKLVTQAFIADGTSIETIYGICVDRSRSRVFIADARGFVNTGLVHCYSLDGYRQFSFSTGINPSKMVLY